MKSSIYISSEKIEVIGYTKSGKNVSVNHYLSDPLPEGTMINGKITDPALLIDRLIALREEMPALCASPALIIDGNFIFSKKIPVPKLNKRQYLQLARDSFADAAIAPEELICDYHMLSSADSGLAIMAYASQKEEIESYLSVFRDAGIKLASIGIGVQAVLNYVKRSPVLQKESFVLNVIDGVTLLSMIFENGNNVFMSRTRLYSEDSKQLVHDMLENLSGLIQFNKSEKFSEITQSYYFGLDGKDLKLMQRINPHQEVNLYKLNIFSGAGGADKLPQDTHFVYLNTLLGDDSIDFMHSYELLKKLGKQGSPQKLTVLALAGLAAVLAVPVIYFSIRIAVVNARIRDISDYITNEATLDRSEELDRIIERTAYYNNIANQLKNKKAEEDTRASISNRALDLITQESGSKVEVIEFAFDEGTEILRVSCRSDTETKSAEYVEELKRSELIKAVHYTGYSYGNDGKFNFSIDVELTAEEVQE